MCNEIRNTSLNNNFTLVLSVPVYIPALVLIWSVYYLEKDVCYNNYQVLFPADNVAMNGILTVPVYCTVDTYKGVSSSSICTFTEMLDWPEAQTWAARPRAAAAPQPLVSLWQKFCPRRMWTCLTTQLWNVNMSEWWNILTFLTQLTKYVLTRSTPEIFANFNLPLLVSNFYV